MRMWAGVLVLLVVGAGCAAADADDRAAPPGPSASSTASTQAVTTPLAPAAPAVAAGPEAWTLVNVTDGDTIDVVSSAGVPLTVRIVGINAPETDECFAQQATDALLFIATNKVLTLTVDISDVDQHGRALRYVAADGADVGADLVRLGFAKAYRYEPDVARADEYDRLQAEAQAASAGLWAPDACGAPIATPGTVTLDADFYFNPPGDESNDLNAETVTITNTGSAPVDLSGWGVADTSATNRYRIPAGTVLAPAATFTIHSGCGATTPTDGFWCSERNAVWNNDGDTIYITDPNGNTVFEESYIGE
jgi:endonuclease YncB( thermonuclease family)